MAESQDPLFTMQRGGVMGTNYSSGDCDWIQEEHFHNENNEPSEYSPKEVVDSSTRGHFSFS